MSYDELVENLGKAKKKIDETFGVNTTEFIPPSLKYSETTREAAKAVGLTENRLRYMPEHWWKNREITSVFFHFWNPRQIRRVKHMLREVTVE
jgi:peptidoglycan/xylan/chitin deacetylase (PgdA/CDA1 family)